MSVGDGDSVGLGLGLGECPGSHCSIDPESGARSMQVALQRSPEKEVKTHQRNTVLCGPIVRNRRGMRTPTERFEVLHTATERSARSR
jgi:hypothetical protein